MLTTESDEIFHLCFGASLDQATSGMSYGIKIIVSRKKVDKLDSYKNCDPWLNPTALNLVLFRIGSFFIWLQASSIWNINHDVYK